MIRYLTLDEILELHRFVIAQTGGAGGIRDLGGIESSAAQPHMTFGGEELYPTLAEKASALGFSLVMNHPFLDGNKRVGHAALETFLILNGVELNAPVEEQESIVLRLAAGCMERDLFTAWVREHVVARPSP